MGLEHHTERRNGRAREERIAHNRSHKRAGEVLFAWQMHKDGDYDAGTYLLWSSREEEWFMAVERTHAPEVQLRHAECQTRSKKEIFQD